MAGNRIAVCVPTRDIVHASFAFDLVQAVAYHMMKHRDAVIPMTDEGTLVQHQRQVLADEAVKAGATHILWLDSDMRFPRDIIERLLEHDKDFVAANCSKRKEPVAPTAIGLDLEHIWPDPDKEGLEEVAVIGFAVVLMKTAILEKMERPYFSTPWYEYRFVGEDTFFCARARAAGIELYIDHDLSWDIKHIGSKPYGMLDVMAEAARSGDN